MERLPERLVGSDVRLVRLDAHGVGSDIRPVTILGSESVRELARQYGQELDARRFRMLIELDTEVPRVEDGWKAACSRART